MKRLFFTITLLTLGFSAKSQVIFSEDFDGVGGPTAGGPGTYTFPSGWLLRNVDNGTPAANVSYVNEAWERREDFAGIITDSVAFSTSWTVPATTSNDWMWTPAVAIPANTVLKWNAKTYDAAYPDGYEVRIMAVAPTGGTGVIGNQITNSTVLFSTAAENPAWTSRQVPLGAYAGQTVYIGFRNISTDKFVLVIDDVVLEVQVQNDLALVSGSVSHGQYTVAPANQLTTAQNILLKGTLTNPGLQPATNAMLSCRVSVNGTFLTTVQSAATPSLAAGATEAKTINFTPTVEGTYTFKFYPSFTETDLVSTNDTLSDPTPLEVTPTQMRRDYGLPVASLGIGAGNGGYLGQTFNLEAPAYISSIKSTFRQGYANRRLASVIYATNGSGVPTTFMAATDTLLYQDDSARTYTLPMHGGSFYLPAGKYAFLQIEFDSTLALAQTSGIFTPNTVYVNWPTNPQGPNFTPAENFGASFAKPFMIAPQFDLCMNVVPVTDTVLTQASCGLSDGSAALTIASGYTITWEDNTTNPTISTLDAGYHVYTVSNQYCSFVDSVQITNPNAPAATAATDMNAACFGEEGQATVTITGGTAPFTVTWSNGDTGIMLTAGAGTYSATIVDDNNCQTSVSGVTIAQPELLVAVTTGTDETCQSCEDGTAAVAITGGTAPYQISWSNGATGTPVTGLAPGTYTVTVTDPNGCTATADVTITDYVSGVGIDELKKYGIIVYPNPVVDYLSIEAEKGDVTDIVLIDASGKTIDHLTKSGNVFTLDMRSLSTGMYQVMIKTKTTTILSKVTKL